MRFEEIEGLWNAEKLPYVSGVERLADGVLHVAILTRMPGVTPGMIGWWFGEYMQTTEHYRRWHPRDHVWMEWEDKQPGTHLGAKHRVHEYIGGRLQKLRIAFVAPETFFRGGVQPGALAICAHTGLLERPIDIGRLIHLALPRPWGCELHSRFWLGEVAGPPGSWLPVGLGNLPPLRRLVAPDSLGRALALHCHEEMTNLAGFLPELHATETGAG